jgi:hypothetical protein
MQVSTAGRAGVGAAMINRIVCGVILLAALSSCSSRNDVAQRDGFVLTTWIVPVSDVVLLIRTKEIVSYDFTAEDGDHIILDGSLIVEATDPRVPDIARAAYLASEMAAAIREYKLIVSEINAPYAKGAIDGSFSVTGPREIVGVIASDFSRRVERAVRRSIAQTNMGTHRTDAAPPPSPK